MRLSHLVVPAILGASLLLGAAEPKDKGPKKPPVTSKTAPAEGAKVAPPKADKAKSLKPKPKGGVADDTI